MLVTMPLIAESNHSISKAQKIVYVFPIRKEIGSETWRITQRAFKEAEAMNASLIIIHMNTYGGLLESADSIRTRLLNSKIPVFVYIDNNAASAGALISIAADKIYMRKGANIGAATVVDQTGKALPDKYQSYMRSMMRATAESHGKDTIIKGKDTVVKWIRDPKIAEAMVDPRTYIRGVNDTGKVLTLTMEEAMKLGFCDGQAKSVKEIIIQSNLQNYQIVEMKFSALDKVVGFLVNPIVQGILIMIIVVGIYHEIQVPGLGFPIAAAIIAAMLYFAPLYLEGLAEHWEIILFIVGLILIALEIFVVPGFGVTGISGIVLTITGLALAMVDKISFNVYGWYAFIPLVKALVIVLVSMLTSFILSLYLSSKLINSSRLSGLSLNTVQDKSEGFVSFDMTSQNLAGKTGVAVTILRPAGKVSIDGTLYDAVAAFGYIEKDEKIKVLKFETGQLYVVKAV
jgi:membrane-bound serine protease (ClpP class)